MGAPTPSDPNSPPRAGPRGTRSLRDFGDGLVPYSGPDRVGPPSAAAAVRPDRDQGARSGPGAALRAGRPARHPRAAAGTGDRARGRAGLDWWAAPGSRCRSRSATTSSSRPAPGSGSRSTRSACSSAGSPSCSACSVQSLGELARRRARIRAKARAVIAPARRSWERWLELGDAVEVGARPLADLRFARGGDRDRGGRDFADHRRLDREQRLEGALGSAAPAASTFSQPIRQPSNRARGRSPPTRRRPARRPGSAPRPGRRGDCAPPRRWRGRRRGRRRGRGASAILAAAVVLGLLERADHQRPLGSRSALFLDRPERWSVRGLRIESGSRSGRRARSGANSEGGPGTSAVTRSIATASERPRSRSRTTERMPSTSPWAVAAVAGWLAARGWGSRSGAPRRAGSPRRCRSRRPPRRC